MQQTVTRAFCSSKRFYGTWLLQSAALTHTQRDVTLALRSATLTIWAAMLCPHTMGQHSPMGHNVTQLLLHGT